MSIEKVNAYKEAKKNRKENIARDKRNKKLTRWILLIIGIAAAVALVVGIVISVKNVITGNTTGEDYISESLVIDDYADIQGTETEEESEEEESESEPESTAKEE